MLYFNGKNARQYTTHFMYIKLSCIAPLVMLSKFLIKYALSCQGITPRNIRCDLLNGNSVSKMIPPFYTKNAP